MSASIKPYSYITYERGTELKPIAYVTYEESTGTPENGTADILRVVLANAAVEEASTDVLRDVRLTITGEADVLREVSDKEAEFGATDIMRRITTQNSVSYDTKRAVLSREDGIDDIDRVVAYNGSYETNVDISRVAAVYNSSTVDIQRTVLDGVPEDGACDIAYFVYAGGGLPADIKRSVHIEEVGSADVVLQTIMHQNGLADTLRDISLHNIGSVDLMRIIPLSISTHENGAIYLGDFPVISMEISLQANTLSDSVRFQIARMNTDGMYPQQAMYGNLLDYNINMDIESTEHQEITQTLNSMYNIEEILYKPYVYSALSSTAKASAHAEKIAYAMGLTPVIRIQDFTPKNNYSGAKVTYQNILSGMFGWTKELPWRNINIFIRDGNMYVIQRGYEPRTFDISNIPHSMPQVNRTIVRNYETSTVTEGVGAAGKGGSVFERYTGYIYDGMHRLKYVNGLCTEERTEAGDWIRHTYDPNTEQVRSTSITHADGSSTVTEYAYGYSQNGQVVATTETETTTDVDGNREVKTTYNSNLGNGATSSMVYSGTTFLGSNKGYGGLTGTATEYTIKQANIALGAKPKNADTEAVWENPYPLTDEEIIEQIFNEIRYYDRKIEERVSIDLTPAVVGGVNSMTHIIDFNDLIQLDGKTYFLESNTVTQTPTSFRQSLQLVRWF